MEYSLIEDNPHFLVVAKPSGVCVHMEKAQMGEGLIVQLKTALGLDALYPVHRLDKVTSGLLLCAKTQQAASELSALFRQRSVEKYYLALSDQKPKKKQGLIKGDMKPARRGAWKLCQTCDNPAITQFFSYSLGQGLRLFLLKPSTGKTHQLRVALKSIGAPIIDDGLYGHPVKKAPGIYLHAYVLRFRFNNIDYSYYDTPKHWQLDIENTVKGKQAIQRPWELLWPKTS